MWIYDRDKQKLRQIKDDDPHIAVGSHHGGPDQIRLYTHWPPVPEKHDPFSMSGRVSYKWKYAYFGATKEECLERVNRYNREKIAELQKQIAQLETELVKG